MQINNNTRFLKYFYIKKGNSKKKKLTQNLMKFWS